MGFLGNVTVAEAARLQGFPELARLADHKAHPGKSFLIHMLGNGVPLAMGRAIAKAVKAAIEERIAE